MPPPLVGVVVGEMSEGKLKKFFNKDITIISVEKKNRIIIKEDIRKGKLTDKTYIYESVSYVNEEELEVHLTRSLAIKFEDNKKIYRYIGISAKYNVQDVKMLNLNKVKNENAIYLKNIEKAKGEVISDKAITEALSGKKYFAIFKDSENPRFSMSQRFLFLDKKPVFYNYHGFSPALSDDEIKSFLLKIDGKMFFLGSFPLSVQKTGWIKEMDSYYLVDLENGKAYIPMDLREEK